MPSFTFTDVYWPDFNERELDLALKEYATRERRFGRISEDTISEDKQDKGFISKFSLKEGHKMNQQAVQAVGSAKRRP